MHSVRICANALFSCWMKHVEISAYGIVQGASVFGESHIDEVAAHYELPVLAKLPIDPKLAAAVDAGKIEDAKLPDELSGALKTVEGLL